MTDQADDRRIAQQISARLSLRKPQRESLDILADLLGRLGLEKEPDLQRWLAMVREQHPTVTAFERTFPSLCFSIATGVGKTRLMGAMIAWLLITGRSRHFFLLAPNLTIYEKLKRDFTLGSSKYVFAGIPELAQTPPVIVTGEDYTDGRGVRLDYAVPSTLTGDIFGAESAPHINIFNIAKINARDNKPGVIRSTTARVRRFQEYLGKSYFDYLAGLPDLVVLMDEAHRYYASAGAQAIADLKPVVGIELTATPKTSGANPRTFRNIVYHYPLAKALEEGFVKKPAVATRKDFRADLCSAEELERIKLEDGIHHHEFVKVALQTYARQHDLPLVKPFILVVAQDTAHASQIKGRIEDDAFFGGRYKGKVIEVHSNLSGEESEEATQRLLAVEHDEFTEVVIHVNKLKEGWDVTNLYTIVPLRASASEILTEQTIGRGLRLPYGRRTGEPAVDRLTIIAHDRFQDIIDRSNAPGSIIRDKIIIGDGDDVDVPIGRPQILVSPSWSEMLATGRNALQDEMILETVDAHRPLPPVNQERELVAGTALKVIAEQAKVLLSSQALNDESVQLELRKQVRERLRANAPAQSQLEGMPQPAALSDEQIDNIVQEVTVGVVAGAMDIPQIIVLPTRDVNYGFTAFDLDGLDRINLQPVSQEILLRHLEDNTQDSIRWGEKETQHERLLEDYLVRRLVDRDEIDYEKYSDLIYKLAGQVVGRLQSYLHEEEAVRNVVVAWQRQLADFIWAQMVEHQWTTPADYIGRVVQGFDVLRPMTLTLAAGERPRSFREPIVNKRDIRQMVFMGYTKCCYPYQKFQSVEGEWRLAQLLEDDATVSKWMKPAPGQFRIEWAAGRNYEPDFVVETESSMLLLEPKQASEIDDTDVQAKARSAIRWCGYANEHADKHGGKRWHYVLVPHTAIVLGASLEGLRAEYEIR